MYPLAQLKKSLNQKHEKIRRMIRNFNSGFKANGKNDVLKKHYKFAGLDYQDINGIADIDKFEQMRICVESKL